MKKVLFLYSVVCLPLWSTLIIEIYYHADGMLKGIAYLTVFVSCVLFLKSKRDDLVTKLGLTLHVLIGLSHVVIQLLFLSGVTHSKPIAGAAGFALGHMYEPAKKYGDLDLIDWDAKRAKYIDKTHPRMEVLVFYNREKVIHTIEKTFSFVGFNQAQKKILKKAMYQEISEAFSTGILSRMHQAYLFDGQRSVEFSNDDIYPSVTYTHLRLKSQSEVFIDERILKSIEEKLVPFKPNITQSK